MSKLIKINQTEIKLEVADDQICTTSLQIASVFEKRHDNIIAKIRELPQDDFNGSNFGLVDYVDSKGENALYIKSRVRGQIVLAKKIAQAFLPVAG